MNKKVIKNGSYSMIYTLILIAVLVVINLIVGEIPEEYTQIDVSENNLYTISDKTKEYLDNLEDDITIYYIVQNGNEDDMIEKMLTRYQEYSDHIEVVTKDPVLYPNFTSQYTENSVNENSLIVVSGDRSKVVDYSNLYETEYDYYSGSSYTTAFDGEGQIDSAISYVTSEELPILYVLDGHGELEISSTLQESLERANYDIQTLNLFTEESVPEDTGCLMLVSPQTDISEEEAAKIIEYLENGGKAMFFVDYMGEEFENIDSVLQNYGITTQYGLVMEGSTKNYIMQMPYYLVPNINSTDFTTDLISENRYVLMPAAQPFQILDTYRDTLEIETVLSTSEDAYLKENVENMQTFEKEDGDLSGEFALGVKITETVGEEETQFVCYGSSALLDDTTDAQVSGGNTDLILSSLGWMCENDTPVIQVDSKDLTMSYLTVPEYDAGYWGAMTCGVIPAACILVGIIIWFKRRKK